MFSCVKLIKIEIRCRYQPRMHVCNKQTKIQIKTYRFRIYSFYYLNRMIRILSYAFDSYQCRCPSFRCRPPVSCCTQRWPCTNYQYCCQHHWLLWVVYACVRRHTCSGYCFPRRNRPSHLDCQYFLWISCIFTFWKHNLYAIWICMPNLVDCPWNSESFWDGLANRNICPRPS